MSSMKKLLPVAVVVLLLFAGCKTHHEVSTSAYHAYETECLGKEMDGTQTLRVWASGKDESDAIEQAKKKAVYDVVFTGISAGSTECNAFPLVGDANARRKHAAYFDKFFGKGGRYKKYVSEKRQDKDAVKHFYGEGRQMVGIIVVVKRAELEQRLAKDGITK